MASWYGHAVPELEPDERTVAASVLWAVRGDATQRALTAWTMGWDVAQEVSRTDWLAPHLLQLLDDPYEVVRLMAYRSLRTLPGFSDFHYDFVGSQSERVDASFAALRRWNADFARNPRRTTGPAVLIAPDGSEMLPDFWRLVDQRDNRVIELDE
jgi:hypothetical protein